MTIDERITENIVTNQIIERTNAGLQASTDISSTTTNAITISEATTAICASGDIVTSKDVIANDIVASGTIDVSGQTNIDDNLVVTGSQNLSGNLNIDGYMQLDTEFSSSEIEEGRISWNSTDGTIEIGMPGGKVKLQVGQEGLVRVRNNSGSDISNGKIVYITGASGQKPTIGLADCSDSDKISLLGMATEDIDDKSNGYVALWGIVRGDTEQPINTSTYAEGTKLYLDTEGNFTSTHPSSCTYATIIIGTVLRQHASEGEVNLNFSYFTIGNNYNGALRQSIINKSTGSDARSTFTSVNDSCHISEIGIGGSANSNLPDTPYFYGEGYADTYYIVDGAKSHKWFTDPTDSHDFSSLSYERMSLDQYGTLTLSGSGNGVRLGDNSVVWDDIRTPAQNVRALPGQEATWVSYKGGLVLKFEKNANQGIAFNVQIPHDYKTSSDLEFHVHAVLPTDGSGAGAENIKWNFTYTWVDIDSVLADPTPVTATIDVQDKNANTHLFQEIAASIDGSSKTGLSSMLICSLTRDVSVDDNYNDAVYVMEVDFHYQRDSLGSSTELYKNY